MSLTEDRIREALSDRAGTPPMPPMTARVRRRVRARQAGLATTAGVVAVVAALLVVLGYGTVGRSWPRPSNTLDPAADGYTSALEDVPPHWPAVDIGDPANAYVPSLAGETGVTDGPTVLASGSVDGSTFTLYAYTLGRGAQATPCLGFVGFAAPGAPTRTAPDVSTCANAPAVPERQDVAFIGAGSSARSDIQANFGFVSRRVDVIYVWGGGRLGMFEMPKLESLRGWDVSPFFFVPAPDAGPLEVDARVRGGDLALAHAQICRPSNVAGTCRTAVHQDFPLSSPVDAPLPLPPGEWPRVTYGGDFEPYVDHEVNANGVVDPGVLGEKTVIAYGTVQGAPWSLVAYNSRSAQAPDGVSPSSDLWITGVGGGGTSLYDATPWEPNDLSMSYGWGSKPSFVDVTGIVTPRVASVRLELSDGTSRDLRLIDGPAGVNARYFVTFLPGGSTGRVVAFDSTGARLGQSCIRDASGTPPGGIPCGD